ncbi:hypothetical protein H3Z83_03995 [Tenacibaculum sp. S7007]|uniref:Outer membrane protein beta-barrel domain-containing protein n=1 Tax=Tenacibaculum pelagium TaxID=2759527 RepID=A0A839AKT1_9FLAO|nr:DUF6588 family protein [Tenacibaculum pelagium]MBA6155685.1 hypothetical protein [Tenacibaculum pelagium]
MKKITLSLLTIFALTFNSKAQELETILLAGNDTNKLMTAYMNPVMKGLVFSMNNGWYHTAKVHKKLGFDITIGASGSFVPSKDEIFNLTKLGLENFNLNGNTTSPTIAADDNINGANLTFSGEVEGINQPVSVTFDMPGGEGLNITPAPAVQIGLGLPFKLEAMLRFVPKVGSDDVKAGLFGLGLKKEITDWFGPMDKTPLHISLLAAYTNMNVDYEIGNITGNVSSPNAEAEFKLNSYTIQAIASLNLPVINFYGGVGYNGGNTKLNILGNYQLNYDGGQTTNVPNPLSLKSDAGSFNATVGARLSLGFFKIFGSYTMQDYSNVNAGIAFSFR